MKKSLIVGMATLSVVGASVIGTSIYAATATNSSTSISGEKMGEFGHMGGRGMGEPGGGMGPIAQMTDAEKSAFEAMSATEKKTYIESKRTEMKARRDAHEAIVDKLLAGTTLTADEEKVRQEIITMRAEIKSKRTEMEANRAKIHTIREKQKAGTSLTTEEQALLDSMPKMGGRGMGRHMMEKNQ